MVTRYYIRKGDRTTADGVVLDGSSSNTAYGIGLSYEGDRVQCPACKSTGQIVCDGPRWSCKSDGRERALSDDLCLCRCSPPPRLIASQTSLSLHMEGSSAATTASSFGAKLPHDEQFLLRDHSTGEPLANVQYEVRTASGNIIRGTTDSSGRTQRIATDSAEQLMLHILHGAKE